MNRTFATAHVVSAAEALVLPVRTERIVWVDTAKGLGIILVVFGHVVRGLISGDILKWSPLTSFVDGWIYAFHMPLFFLLSGFFLVRSTEKPWTKVASDKLRTIAYPYFIWSIITVIIKAALGDLTNDPNTLSDLILILYKPIGQFWFLYVLFILSLLVSALLSLRVSPWMIFIFSILLYPGMLPTPSYGWGMLSVASMNMIYVALGVVIGRRLNLRAASTISSGWLMVACGVGFLISSLGGELPDQPVLAPLLAFSGIAATIALANLVARIKLYNAIQTLGRNSLEIYVVHTIASAGVRIMLLKVGHISAPLPHLVLGTLVGLYLPIALVLLFRRSGFRFGFTLPARSNRSGQPI